MLYGMLGVIAHRLIFSRAHWTKHITWYKIGPYPPSNFIDERKTRKEVPSSGFNASIVSAVVSCLAQLTTALCYLRTFDLFTLLFFSHLNFRGIKSKLR